MIKKLFVIRGLHKIRDLIGDRLSISEMCSRRTEKTKFISLTTSYSYDSLNNVMSSSLIISQVLFYDTLVCYPLGFDYPTSRSSLCNLDLGPPNRPQLVWSSLSLVPLLPSPRPLSLAVLPVHGHSGISRLLVVDLVSVPLPLSTSTSTPTSVSKLLTDITR